ncbi:energy transducer TonB [Candidimonas nitroreducens]|uniref:Energy transducer TonB n=1 Tax=Candidimonas nitroreducens TaxID=683354 RepID=A0A225MDA8_9BURK|nr:TonB family protein [Candidimonas nitroreducens]OWT58213.1 energy transducer TonB [Candidimonas nitroreducens]
MATAARPPRAADPGILLRYPRLWERRRYLYAGLAVSLCAHLALLALRLAAAPAAPVPPNRMQVALINARSDAAPLRPRLLAQHALDGGGNADAGHAATPLPRNTDESANEIVLQALRKRQAELEAEQRELYTQLQARLKTPQARKSPDLFEQSDDPGNDERYQQNLMLNSRIGALEARIERYNARPRERYTGPSAAEADYAQYVEAWRKKIELLGTEHYPQGPAGGIHGDLQLTVYIKKDGELARVEIDRPSEHAELNLAARRIVQLAAPFAPLPPAVAAHTDVLAITRTWHFINDRLDTTQTP